MFSIYVETTVIGMVAGRNHPDWKLAARQELTREWWSTAAERYELLISQLVLDECLAGDPMAAEERMTLIRNIPLLKTSPEVDDLTAALLARKAVPETQPRDAFHIAIGAVRRVQYIVTWNFKHIANPTQQRKIAEVCNLFGLNVPVICTPEQLWEIENDSKPD